MAIEKQVRIDRHAYDRYCERVGPADKTIE